MSLGFQRELFPFASKAALRWQSRMPLFEAEIKQLQTDIICLQEVDAPNVPSFWKPFLESLGMIVL